jgi:glycosyltransferase involved in cell wall biosynthesis
MINILFITPMLGRGGAERQLLDLLKGLDKKKFNPILVIMNLSGERVKEAMNLGIKVIFILRKWRWDISPLFKIIKIIKTHDISIVHAWGMMPSFYSILAKAFVPFTWINGSIRCSKHRFTWRMILRQLFLLPADYRVANSYAGLKAFGFKSNYKNKVIYNGIETPNASLTKSHIRKMYRISKNKVVCTAGRLEYEKDFIGFLKVAKMVIRQYKDVCFLIVGNGSRMNELKAYGERLNISDDIIFTDFVNDIHSIYNITDVFVLLSFAYHGEGFSNVIGEAMSHGISVIANETGGNTEIIKHRESGFLYPVGDYKKVAEKVVDLLKNRDLYKRISKNAEERIINNFSLEIMIENYQNFYSKASH